MATGANNLFWDDYPYTLQMTCAPANAPQLGVFWKSALVPDGGGFDFGIGQLGSALHETLIVTNLGDANLTVWSLNLCPNTGCFVLDSALTNTGDHTLGPGAGTNLTVWFMPLEPGQTNSVLTIGSDDPQVSNYQIHLAAFANASAASAPTVQLKKPSNGAHFVFPSEIAVEATAGCSANTTLWGIDFLATSPTGEVLIGQSLAGANLTSFSGGCLWSRPTPGTYTLKAVARDHAGAMGQSALDYNTATNSMANATCFQSGTS